MALFFTTTKDSYKTTERKGQEMSTTTATRKKSGQTQQLR